MTEKLKVIKSNGLAPKNASMDGKPKVTLIPMDILIEFLVPAYDEGIEKYERESWRRGFPVSEMIDACKRHTDAFFHDNEDIDPDSTTKKHHLAGAIFSLISALHTLKYHPELDDRTDPATGDSNTELERAKICLKK